MSGLMDVLQVGQVQVRRDLAGSLSKPLPLTLSYDVAVPQGLIFNRSSRPSATLGGVYTTSYVGSIPNPIVPVQNLIFNDNFRAMLHAKGSTSEYKNGPRAYAQFIPQYIIMDTRQQEAKELKGVSLSGTGSATTKRPRKYPLEFLPKRS
ncbi:hypothetical protein [Paenibacillus sp. P32E]|uniref:hypothetical protein n=1 Tax=Paenibacillus sp. P32E TaxID=1349434 RepID=UPI00093F3C0B|nr:hypothetical protein [Paenibacillus sp. P32E]OKP93688.1 hypothetical protein A3848_04045 [Paenibacillus sp. P32E]